MTDGRRTVKVPVYEYVDTSSPGTYFDDLEEALRIGPTMVEITEDEARSFRGVRRHFDQPKVPDPETLSNEPAPGAGWLEVLRTTRGAAPGRRADTLQYALTRGTCGWRRTPTLADLKRAVDDPAPDEWARLALKEWAETVGWRTLALGWAHGLYTPASLAAALHRTGLARCPAAHHLRMGSFARPGRAGANGGTRAAG